jgi:hypothetical protein
MITLLATITSLLSFRIPSRTSLELEVIALQRLLSLLFPQQTFKEINSRPNSDAEEVPRRSCETLGGPCQRMQCPHSGDRSEAR